MAQVVSRRLPNTVARVRAQVSHVGFVVIKVELWAGILRVLRFPLPIVIPPTAPRSSSSSIIRGWYNGSNSGQSTKWTQSHLPPQE
jgi:hypothetical protein